MEEMRNSYITQSEGAFEDQIVATLNIYSLLQCDYAGLHSTAQSRRYFFFASHESMPGGGDATPLILNPGIS
jgi:hypothetical protein